MEAVLQLATKIEVRKLLVESDQMLGTHRV